MSKDTGRSFDTGEAQSRPGPLAKAAFFAAATAAAFLFVYMVIGGGTGYATVATTKHNLGSLSTAAVKSTDTTEICVFCHTPHTTSPQKPLWNKKDMGNTYNIYASQTMVAAVGQPTGSSKLCLSCHDGTIALGELLNLPGPGGYAGVPLSVTGPSVDAQGKIIPAAASYIGTDLRDDHPISFDYGLSYPSNTEIKASSGFPAGVTLDSSGKVQCTSCHDPHGTNYPKFMVASLQNGALCTACHAKRYWDTMPSVHRDSTATWNGTGQNPWFEDMGAAGYTDDTPAMQSCLSCHKSHGAATGKSLLRGVNPSTGAVVDEEWTCLNCHNGNVAQKNIDALFNYSSKHDVKGVYGAHVPSRASAGVPARETGLNLGTNRHAECADCHNPHGAKSGNHTVGGVNGNIIGPNLLGGWGVKPNPWNATPGTVTTVYDSNADFTSLLPGAPYNLEGYLCMKCHTYFAYGNTAPNVPSGNADGSLVKEQDISIDFNTNNMSYHPVFEQTGKNRPLTTANPNWPANGLGLTNTFRYVDFPGIGQRTGFYNVTHDSKITCSDCHGSHNANDPQGPHASNNKWLLRSNETGVGSTTNFCYNCHRRDVYGDENYVGSQASYARVTHPVDGLGALSPFYKTGTNTGNNSNKFGILCLSCHGGAYDSVNNVMLGIHGSNAAAGSQPGSDPLGYRMMKGACVESYIRPTTATSTQMFFRVVTPATDKVCNNNFTNFTNGNMANYNCNTIGDCSN